MSPKFDECSQLMSLIFRKHLNNHEKSVIIAKDILNCVLTYDKNSFKYMPNICLQFTYIDFQIQIKDKCVAVYLCN